MCDEELKQIRRERYQDLTDRVWVAICNHLDPGQNYDFSDDSDRDEFCESVERMLGLLEMAGEGAGVRPSGESTVSLRKGATRGQYAKAIRRRHRVFMLRAGLLFYVDALKARGKLPVPVTWAECARYYNRLFHPEKLMSGDSFKHAFHRSVRAFRAVEWEDIEGAVLEELLDLHKQGFLCNGTSWLCPARKQLLDLSFYCEIMDQPLHPYNGCIYLAELVCQHEEGGQT